MAMWFVHLEAVEEAARRLDFDLEPSALAWGAVCCDVDKVSRVPRADSHLASVPRPVTARALMDALELEPEQAAPARSFICGVHSHLVVDDAWYSGLLEALERHPVPGFTEDGMRALNLLLDMSARSRIRVDGLVLEPTRGEELLPFLAPRPAATLRAALRFYLAWDGDIGRAPHDPHFVGWVDRFRALLERERPRLEPFLASLDEGALMARVCEATTRAMAGWADLRPSGRLP